MPRIRTLKPEHRQHRKIGRLSHLTYRLWVGMILEADDEGRLVCDPEQLRVTIFGYHPKVSRALVESSLGELQCAGLLKMYAAEGTEYAWFPSWHDHQRIDHATPSKLPAYDDSLNVRECSRGLANPHVGSDLDLIGKEGKGVEGLTPPAREPSTKIEFKVNDEIQGALHQAPTLGAVSRLWTVEFWRAEIRANGELDMPAEILKAEAWLTANRRAPRKDLARFLHNWLARADRETE